MTCWSKCANCGHYAESHIESHNGDRCESCAHEGKTCSAYDVPKRSPEGSMVTAFERSFIKKAAGDRREALRQLGALRSVKPDSPAKATGRAPEPRR